MKILFLVAYYTPEIAASMYLTEDFIEEMANAGHYIDIYAPMPCRGISDDIREQYRKRKKEIQYDGHVTIHRFSFFKESKNTILRAIRYIILNIVFFLKGLFAKTDAIFVYSTPPTQGFIAACLSVIKKKPFIYNLQDIFPDSLVNTGMTSNRSLIWKIGRVIENYTYKHASKIIVISDDFMDNITKKGVNKEKIVVIPNWADVDGVYPIEKKDNILFDRLKIDSNKFIITYSGNIGYTQNMEMLLEAAMIIQTKLPQIIFVIIGDGAAKKEVEEQIKRRRIENIFLYPFQPYEDIANVFSLGDLGLIISKIGVGENSVPSKTWGIMAAKRPIIASFDKSSDLCKLISKIECGLYSEANNLDEFIEIIEKMYEERDLINRYGENGYRYVHSVLCRDVNVKKYRTVIEQSIL